MRTVALAKFAWTIAEIMVLLRKEAGVQQETTAPVISLKGKEEVKLKPEDEIYFTIGPGQDRVDAVLIGNVANGQASAGR